MADEKGDIRLRIRKDVEAFLKSLGSTTSEIKVFMALNKLKRYTSVKEIEELTSLSSKSIRQALKKLEEKGLITCKESGGKRLCRSKSVKDLVEAWKKKVERLLDNLFRRP